MLKKEIKMINDTQKVRTFELYSMADRLKTDTILSEAIIRSATDLIPKSEDVAKLWKTSLIITFKSSFSLLNCFCSCFNNANWIEAWFCFPKIKSKFLKNGLFLAKILSTFFNTFSSSSSNSSELVLSIVSVSKILSLIQEI